MLYYDSTHFRHCHLALDSKVLGVSALYHHELLSLHFLKFALHVQAPVCIETHNKFTLKHVHESIVE